MRDFLFKATVIVRAVGIVECGGILLNVGGIELGWQQPLK